MATDLRQVRVLDADASADDVAAVLAEDGCVSVAELVSPQVMDDDPRRDGAVHRGDADGTRRLQRSPHPAHRQHDRPLAVVPSAREPSRSSRARSTACSAITPRATSCT